MKKKGYEIDLDSACDDFFHKMEEIGDSRSHVVFFPGLVKQEVAKRIAERLTPWLESLLQETSR